MRRLLLATALGCALGVGGGLVLGGPVADALAKPPREGFPPDPPPKQNTKQWVFQIDVKQGVPSLGKVTPVTLKKAEATPRVMGRYALELYVGTEILDRLRFNVPLGGDGPREGNDQPGRKKPEFRANAKFFVRVADHARATRLRFVDRASGEVTVFFWPPEAGGALKPVASDAGAAADAGSSDAGSSDAGSSDAGSSDAGGPDGGARRDAGAADAGRHDPADP